MAREGDEHRRSLRAAPNAENGTDLGRRAFLRWTGLGAAGVAGLGLANGAAAQQQGTEAPATRRVRTVCTHCAVGCTIEAEVEGGRWVGQEPGFDSPINMGGLCAKGAAARETALSARRLRYPMKLVGGQWRRVSWDDALADLSDHLLDIRAAAGPDAVYWLGSANHSNEQAYLLRKMAACWGTNNIDHPARIDFSGSVAGVSATWGFGATTNSLNDIHNSRCMLVLAGDPAEDHPVAMLHMLRAKERNGAPLIVAGARRNRTAAHADEFLRLRPGADVAFVWGLVWHILQNGWEDADFVDRRVWGVDQIRGEVAKWTPEEVEAVTGLPGAQVEQAAWLMASNRPGVAIWSDSGSQGALGSSITRAYCILQLVLGNVGVAGGGTVLLAGADNMQGVTDMGVACHTLPGYYGLREQAWKHWARAWGIDFHWLRSRFASEELMQARGIPASRWFDGVLGPRDAIEQPEPVRAAIFWGYEANLGARLADAREAMRQLDLLVVIDPYATAAAAMHGRTDGVYLLPSTTQYETHGSVTSTSRQVQWRETVIDPLFEAKPDHVIMTLLARRLGFDTELLKQIEVNVDEPSIDDINREMTGALPSIGYTGHSPERLRAHMRNQVTFDRTTLRARGGPVNGEYYGLPWPCWGRPDTAFAGGRPGHPGTPVLFDTTKPVVEGGSCFPARFGVERDGRTLLASEAYPVGSEIEAGYPAFTMRFLEDLGWAEDLTEEERLAIGRVAGPNTSWRNDISGGIQRVALMHGCAPHGNARARALVWNFPDPVPIHREPLYSTRRELVETYPTYQDTRNYRLPVRYESVQARDVSLALPIMLTTGRLTEYAGGGTQGRGNAWLAELQQRMFVEVNPVDANNFGVRDGDVVWVVGPEGDARIRVTAMVTERVGPGVAFLPVAFAGHWMGQSLLAQYPEGAAPYVLGEPAGAVLGYGYDPVTHSPETKVGVCRIEKA